MSGPFGVSMVVIGGREKSAEVVVAASTFLSMAWQSSTPLSVDKNVREEFLAALEAFELREGLDYHQRPEYFVKRLIEPKGNISTEDFFWLALDQEGASLAKDIFLAKGESPEKRVHRSVCKVNLIEQAVSPAPLTNASSDFWLKIQHDLFRLSLGHHKSKPSESYQEFINHHAPLTPLESEYYSWFKSLYETLTPWRQVIKNIQSDLS